MKLTLKAETGLDRSKNIPPPFLSSDLILDLTSKLCIVTAAQKMHTELHTKGHKMHGSC